MTVKAFGTRAADLPLEPLDIPRRLVGERDVRIAISYCGVCHSDVHAARNGWGGARYPCVPGHEIIGQVTAIGRSVTRFREGETVGVGCLVNSCRTCEACVAGFEQYCNGGKTETYNSRCEDPPGHTLGGYSQAIVVDESFVLRINHPAEQLPAVAPLLCAGITCWSPLRHWKAGPGRKVGIVGIGGLGHMGVKLASALGAHTVAFTTSESKRQAALDLGADEVVLSKDAAEMAAHLNSFDLIINTLAVPHELGVYVALLARDGVLCMVGAPEEPHPSPSVLDLIRKRRSIAGSQIGGLAETQDMLDFCAEHGLVADIEMIAIQDINTAWERMLKSDVRYRFVIDSATFDA